uniref:Uncharacterized protein n=1 Tax=Saimiri boliviensis boliviensis TaxID=39432 RepID=A0A2K6V5U1_SAIBB
MILHLENILASGILNITIEKDKSTNRFGEVFLHILVILVPLLTYCLIGHQLYFFTRYVSLSYSR